MGGGVPNIAIIFIPILEKKTSFQNNTQKNPYTFIHHHHGRHGHRRRHHHQYHHHPHTSPMGWLESILCLIASYLYTAIYMGVNWPKAK